MINGNLLKAYIKLRGQTQRSVSKDLDMSEVSFSTKLNGKDGKCFNHREIEKLVVLLDIPKEDMISIFFNNIFQNNGETTLNVVQ